MGPQTRFLSVEVGDPQYIGTGQREALRSKKESVLAEKRVPKL